MKLYFRVSKSTTWLLVFSASLFLIACKKDKNTPNDSGNTTPVSITHIESYGTANLSLSYNTNGTVKSIVFSGYEFNPNLTFTYNPNTILIQENSPTNNRSYLDSVSLNSSGRILNVRTFNYDKTYWDKNQYTLNTDNEIVQMEQGVSTSHKTAKFPHTYINGNLIRDATAAVYLYDLTKPAQFGDRHSIMNFLSYGVKYNLIKNLVTAAVFGKDTTFYKYTYDKAGRISEYEQVRNGNTYSQFKLSY